MSPAPLASLPSGQRVSLTPRLSAAIRPVLLEHDSDGFVANTFWSGEDPLGTRLISTVVEMLFIENQAMRRTTTTRYDWPRITAAALPAADDPPIRRSPISH